ncbi:MAG: hypothetical protein Q9195_004333 [Heterodermia aff. obscurata]
MHSKFIVSTAALTSVAFAQFDLPIPSEDAQGLESLVQGVIPTGYKSLIPSETKVVNDIAAYVTSITAQPEFSSAVAALETAIPLTAFESIGESPEDFIMELATGTIPSWFTAIPTSVIDYVESIGEQAVSLLEADTGISSIPADLVGEVEATGTAAYEYATAAYGGYPTGGYPTGGYPYGTGAYYPTGTAGSSGYAAPTGNSSVVPYSPSASPQAFTGAAPSRTVALGAAAMVAGVAAIPASSSRSVPPVTVFGPGSIQRSRPFDARSFFDQIANIKMGVENEKERVSAEIVRSGPASSTAPVLPTVNPAVEKKEVPASTFHPAVYVMYVRALD